MIHIYPNRKDIWCVEETISYYIWNDRTFLFQLIQLLRLYLACCILRNYLIRVDPDERLIAEVDQEISNDDIHNEARNSTNESDVNASR